jgi:hypothetical protein
MNDLQPALLDVRRSFRLLYNYQRAAMDAASYIGNKLGFEYQGGYPKFSNSTPKASRGSLQNWAWDWLNMMFYEFHFLREVEGEPPLGLSMFLISDTGFFCSEQETPDKKDVAAFLPAEKSRTVVGFLLAPLPWPGTAFIGDKEKMKTFIEQSKLPEVYRAQGAYAACHDFARVCDEASTDKLIEELIAGAQGVNIRIQCVESKS